MRGNELRQRRDDARNRYVLIIRRLRIRRFDQLLSNRELKLADKGNTSRRFVLYIGI